jgi:glycosyltransferase involved in cell wall biosynthesis
LKLLRDAGWDVIVSPLLSDDYIKRLYTGRRNSFGEIARRYVSRISDLLGARSYDLIWIEREVFPWIPDLFERVLLPKCVPYVLDFDDAVFHRYDMHPSRIVRWILGAKIDRLMRGAAVVIVGNDYIRDRALAAEARQIEVLPTVVDLARYRPEEAPPRAWPVIGWIGTPNTQPFLDVVSPALVELRREHNFKVLLIGANMNALPTVAHETVAWSEDTEAESIRMLDIGIMPLPVDSFTKGKCGYKLIQYMACGLPVVASPVGVNSKLIHHGGNGYLAETKEEWVEALDALLSNRALRLEMGVQGRGIVEEHYSLDVTGPELLRILTSACRS